MYVYIDMRRYIYFIYLHDIHVQLACMGPITAGQAPSTGHGIY